LSIYITKAQGAAQAVSAEFIHDIPRHISLKVKDKRLTQNWRISQYIFKAVVIFLYNLRVVCWW